MRPVNAVAAALDRVNVDTDQIIPKQFLKRVERTGFGQFAFFDWRFLPNGEPNPSFELNDPGYAGATILVAGRNFGCGSSREHAPIAIKGSGARCVIAASFARIFFRNAINIGLPILECPEAVAEITEGDEIEVDLTTGEIFNHSNGRRYQARPLPEFVLKIAEAGGIVNFLKEHDIQELLA